MLDFVRGDSLCMEFPAHPEALTAAGAEFLTKAFHAFGSLDQRNRVSRIKSIEPCPGGSTGQKVFCSVEFARNDEHLDTELFVKFSRDFTDEIRDRQRVEMESEVRLGALSRHPNFPIPTPTTYFADFQIASGTGILITRRIPYGRNGIEPHRPKSLDHKLANPLEYYRAIFTALGRLVAAHKSGRLSPEVDRAFPFDMQRAVTQDRIPYDENGLLAQLDRVADFAERAPQLFPDDAIEPDFLARLKQEAVRFLRHESDIKRFLHANSDFIALCHWNANIDNAWFWRDARGNLQCGLIDWGRVRQLNLAYPIWGTLLVASEEIWDHHLAGLLELFSREISDGGGPRLAIGELLLHLELYVATIGLAAVIVAPDRILHRLPEAVDATDALDPVFERSEQARNFLVVLRNFLKLWKRHDFGATLDTMLGRI